VEAPNLERRIQQGPDFGRPYHFTDLLFATVVLGHHAEREVAVVHHQVLTIPAQVLPLIQLEEVAERAGRNEVLDGEVVPRGEQQEHSALLPVGPDPEDRGVFRHSLVGHLPLVVVMGDELPSAVHAAGDAPHDQRVVGELVVSPTHRAQERQAAALSLEHVGEGHDIIGEGRLEDATILGQRLASRIRMQPQLGQRRSLQDVDLVRPVLDHEPRDQPLVIQNRIQFHWFSSFLVDCDETNETILSSLNPYHC